MRPSVMVMLIILNSPLSILNCAPQSALEGVCNMPNDTILQRFKQFRAMAVSSNIPNSLLMDMIESYITTDDEDIPAAEPIAPLDGQMSLFDTI